MCWQTLPVFRSRRKGHRVERTHTANRAKLEAKLFPQHFEGLRLETVKMNGRLDISPFVPPKSEYAKQFLYTRRKCCLIGDADENTAIWLNMVRQSMERFIWPSDMFQYVERQHVMKQLSM